jgi:NitT/TauT family transport system substrate-binding protein
MNKRSGIYLFIAAVGALLVAAWMFSHPSAISPQSDSLTKVIVRLKWVHQAQFAGFYVASEKGFYKDAGLDVDVESGGSNFPAIQTVVSGDEDFGVTGADQVLIARSRGADVVPLLVIYQQTPFVLFARRDGSIKTFKDIVGKRIGVKLGGNEELTYRAMLAAARIDSKSINEVPVNIDMSLFFNGNVDVWPGYSINEPLVAEEKGIPVTLFSPDQLGIKLYADTLFTTSARIKQNPVIINRFVEATRKGWDYAIQHPEEAAQITMKYAAGTTLVHETAMMKASLPSLLPPGSHFGDMTLADWQAMDKLLLDGRFLEKSIDIDGMLAEARLDEAAGK